MHQQKHMKIVLEHASTQFSCAFVVYPFISCMDVYNSIYVSGYRGF